MMRPLASASATMAGRSRTVMSRNTTASRARLRASRRGAIVQHAAGCRRSGRRGSGMDINGLVDVDKGIISREIFVSEEIYRRELEQVFARAWLFVAHES